MELAHDDIGIMSPPAQELIMERVEDIVDHRTAEWLVPRAELTASTWRRVGVEPVTALLVAEEFRVTVEVACRALLELAREAR